MFCDGKCDIKVETAEGTLNKRCGLFRNLIHSNELTGETKEFGMCVFDGILQSMLRTEQGQVRVQAAIESARNEQASGLRSMRGVLVQGFMGVMESPPYGQLVHQGDLLVDAEKVIDVIPEVVGNEN